MNQQATERLLWHYDLGQRHDGRVNVWRRRYDNQPWAIVRVCASDTEARRWIKARYER
jgi:hypothetical protein